MAKGGILKIPPPRFENLPKYPPPPRIAREDPPSRPREGRKFIENHANWKKTERNS